MIEYYLKIANLIICVESSVPVYLRGSIEPFQIQNSQMVDILYRIEWITEPFYEQKIVSKSDFAVYKISNSYIRKKNIRISNQTKTIILQQMKLGREYLLKVPMELLEKGRLFLKTNIFDFLALEEGFLTYNALILHSSFISWQGNGIVFTAPSGTGKSTQADLWHEYEGAEIYNGDRTIIRKIDNVYHGFGSPYAGSSGIYRNETAPIKAIIVLTQAPENRIERLTGKQAFTPLYKETLMNTWNPEYMNKMTDLLMDVAAKIPIYHLACRPDREAVELVKKTLFQE